MFIDLVGSSEVASLRDLGYYRDDYLKEFSETINTVLDKHRISEEDQSNGEFISEIRGDELFLLLASNPNNDSDLITNIRTDIIKMFSIGLDIKYRWLFNKKCGIDRLKEMKAPFEIAIGINTGQVLINKVDEKWVAEGYAINLAKRIESESRKGDASNIFVSENTYGYYSDISGENVLRFKQQEKTELKGISGNIRIYELIFANLDEDDEIVQIPSEWLIDWDEKKKDLEAIEKMFLSTLNPWLGNVLCNLFWRKESEPLKAIDKLQSKNSLEPEDKVIIKDLKENSEPNLRKAIEIARKLIEIESDSPVWKIYLAQILFDYLYYDLNDVYSDSIDVSREKNIIFNDTVRQLISLTEREPNEVDAWLYLGRLYLEIENDPTLAIKLNSKKVENIDRKKVDILNDAVNCFHRVISWDQEYPEAYYYLAAGKLAKEDPEDEVWKIFIDGLDWADKSGKKKNMLELALTDPLLKSIQAKIRNELVQNNT